MSHADVQNDPRPSSLRQIDVIVDRFEEEWRQGSPPRIAAYLGGIAGELRLDLLTELVCVDLEQRLRANRPVPLTDYLREFPELETLPPEGRAELESYFRERLDKFSETVDHVPRPADSMPKEFAAVGRYPIAGRLAPPGGQAEVFLAFHPEFLVPVVVKCHKGQQAPSPAQRALMIREGQILANLPPHPNLVRVYDLGFHEDRPFLVLEHVPGRTLEQEARDSRPSPQRAAELVAALARGVQAAHDQGVIHQDIKPANVVLDGRGEPRLIDFGLAWFRPAWADPAVAARPDGGTLRYLSPEQADPELGHVGRRTDVFGLGAVLFHLLTGRALYEGTNVKDLLEQARTTAYDASALERAGVPKRLAAVCRQALARDPDQRFATAADLARALTRSVRPPRWRSAAILAGLFLIAVAGGWLLGQVGLHAPGPEALALPLEVQIWRPETKYVRLAEALPVRTGDELQVRFHVPPRLHVSLFSINGQGRLTLLEQYPPQEDAAERVYPGPDQARRIGAPEGTEVLLVCGRAEAPVNEADVQAAWANAGAWPELSPGLLLRLQPGGVREEGERSRDFGEVRDRPDADGVARRLEQLRNRLKRTCPFFEGLAFRHIPGNPGGSE